MVTSRKASILSRKPSIVSRKNSYVSAGDPGEFSPRTRRKMSISKRKASMVSIFSDHANAYEPVCCRALANESFLMMKNNYNHRPSLCDVIQRRIAPDDQLYLTEEELNEDIDRVIEATNPNAPHNVVQFSFAEDTFKQLPSVEQTEMHYKDDGYVTTVIT